MLIWPPGAGPDTAHKVPGKAAGMSYNGNTSLILCSANPPYHHDRFDTHQERDMNAAKKIRKLIESGAAEGDVAVLVDLARSLETGVPFQLSQLNALDMRNFDLAMELIADWRFDHHIPARRKLTDVIMNLHEESAAESVDLAPMAERIEAADKVE